MGEFHILGFLIFHFYISLTEWSCWEAENQCSSFPPHWHLNIFSQEKTLNKKRKRERERERGRGRVTELAFQSILLNLPTSKYETTGPLKSRTQTSLPAHVEIKESSFVNHTDFSPCLHQNQGQWPLKLRFKGPQTNLHKNKESSDKLRLQVPVSFSSINQETLALCSTPLKRGD